LVTQRKGQGSNALALFCRRRNPFVLKAFGEITVSSEVMVFNNRQGIVLDDIARFWKDDKQQAGREIPCIFFVDIRGASFHVTYSENAAGRKSRDLEFTKLAGSL
jgi:hypothetical protein